VAQKQPTEDSYLSLSGMVCKKKTFSLLFSQKKKKKGRESNRKKFSLSWKERGVSFFNWEEKGVAVCRVRGGSRFLERKKEKSHLFLGKEGDMSACEGENGRRIDFPIFRRERKNDLTFSFSLGKGESSCA